MREKLLAAVQTNTANRHYAQSNATELGEKLNLSRNRISQYLNDYYNDRTFIKINTRPVIFIDRKTIETSLQVRIDQNLFNSLEDFQQIVEANQKFDFQKLIGEKGSLHEVVDSCKASISYPPHGLPTLLCGATGTGKSTIARYMYEYGVNKGLLEKGAPFVHVNCSEYANNPELITANLFGYKKGGVHGR